jgi:signal transduction histidine kinase
MKSIGIKLWVWVVALVAFLLVMLWLFQIVFLESFYTKIKMAELKKEGYSIASMIASNKKEEVQKQIDILSYKNNASIVVLNRNLELLYSETVTTDTRMQMPMGKNQVIIDAIGNVLQGNEVSLGLTHPRFGNKFYLIGIPINDSFGENLAILINTPLAPVKDTAEILQKQFGIIIFILLFVTIIFAYFLSNTFSKPIRIITKIAQEIASGNYNTRINIKSKDEIGKLAQTINNMGEGLAIVENQRRDLIANVSHELRTPLTLIRSYAETTRDVSGDNKEKRDSHLNVIIEETERLGRMVDDILNLSQLQSGNISLNLTEFDVKVFLFEFSSKYELMGKNNGVEISVDCDNIAIVQADKERIQQVLYNLVSNSLNHTNEGGKIIIKANDLGDFIKVSVEDTGSGISKENLDHIWDRFYKANHKAGTGIGLTIVKSIFDAHNFQYGVDSIVGKGTKIWFNIKKIKSSETI